jgi:ribonuclease HI
LIQGLILAHRMEIIDLLVMGDLELVINQVWKRYNTKKERLKTYVERVWDLIQTFNYLNISLILRERNKRIDSLVVLTSLFNLESVVDNHIFWQIE